MRQTLEDSKIDLDGHTVEEAVSLRESGLITSDKAEELINAIKSLQFIVDSYPDMISRFEKHREELISDLIN